MARDSKGRFQKGNSGNPGGRPGMSDDMRNYGKDAPKRLRAIADDPNTPVRVRADIERWFAEMVMGKPKQGVEMEGTVSTDQSVRFEGALEQWSK